MWFSFENPRVNLNFHHLNKTRISVKIKSHKNHKVKLRQFTSASQQLDFKEDSPAATDKTLIQREAQAHITDDLTISSPLLAEDGKIDFMNNFAYPTEAELKEILKYIAAKQVYFV